MSVHDLVEEPTGPDFALGQPELTLLADLPSFESD